MCTINNNDNTELHLWTENKQISILEYNGQGEIPIYEYKEYPCTILKYKAKAVWQKLAGLHLVINAINDNSGVTFPKWEDIYQYTSYHSDVNEECLHTGFEEDGLIQKKEWGIKSFYEPSENILLAGKISSSLVPSVGENTGETQTTVTTTTTTTSTDAEGNVVTTTTSTEVTTTENAEEDIIEEGVLANFVNTTFSIQSIKGLSNEYGNLLSANEYQVSNPNKITQTIEFREGYTWFSLYVIPGSGNRINNILPNAIENQKVLGETSQSLYSFGMGETLMWSNSSYIFDNNRGHIMYIPSNSDSSDSDNNLTSYTLTVEGDTKETNDIILYPGWSWISYPSLVEREVGDVFSDSLVGDKVLGAYSQTAYMNKFGCLGWSQTSFLLKPSHMYKVYNSCSDVKVITLAFKEDTTTNLVSTTTTTTTTTYHADNTSNILSVVQMDENEERRNVPKKEIGKKEIIYKLKQGWNELIFQLPKQVTQVELIKNPQIGDRLFTNTFTSEYSNIFGNDRWSAILILKPGVKYKYFSISNKALRTI